MGDNRNMAARKKAAPKATKTLEQTLWDAADKMRGNLEAGEYKHVVLGLVTQYDYPPDKEEKAIELVLEQAELFATDEAA